MGKRERTTAQSGNKKEPAKKLYDFFCLGGREGIDGVHFGREKMTEAQAKEHAKDFELRYEGVNQ